MQKKANLVSHWQPHPEEIGAMILMAQYEDVFPGAATAKAVFPLDPELDVYTLDNSYFIGVRPPGDLDEHGRKEKSAFSIVADKLDLSPNSVWGRFRAYVEKADSADSNGGNSRGGPLNIYSMMDCVHWANVGSSEEGANWCFEGLKAVEGVGMPYFSGGEDNFGRQMRFFELIVCMWVGKKFSRKRPKINDLMPDFFPAKGYSKLGISQVLSRVKRSKDRILTCDPKSKGLGRLIGNDRNPWSLPRMTYAVYQQAGGNGRNCILAAYRWAVKALDAYYDRQKDFFSALSFIDRGDCQVDWMEIWPGQPKKATVWVPNNQHRMTLAACRYKFKGDFGVLVQSNQVTGTQVFANSRIGFNPLDQVVALIREEEGRLLGKANGYDHAQLMAPGNSCGLNHVYYVVQERDNGKLIGSNMILNRSEARPSVEPMKIRWPRLCKLVEQGLAANCK